MKTIKIRFVQTSRTPEEYIVQRKTWYGGWKYITFTINMGYGSIVETYSANTKEKLLETILEKYYKRDKRFVLVVEYPTLLMY